MVEAANLQTELAVFFFNRALRKHPPRPLFHYGPAHPLIDQKKQDVVPKNAAWHAVQDSATCEGDDRCCSGWGGPGPLYRELKQRAEAMRGDYLAAARELQATHAKAEAEAQTVRESKAVLAGGPFQQSTNGPVEQPPVPSGFYMPDLVRPIAAVREKHTYLPSEPRAWHRSIQRLTVVGRRAARRARRRPHAVRVARDQVVELATRVGRGNVFVAPRPVRSDQGARPAIATAPACRPSAQRLQRIKHA
jgi:hypothetical protein